MSDLIVDGFVVRGDFAYELDSHMWVDARGNGRVRVGMDALGLETAGTLAQLQFADPGTEIERGEPFGSLEAEKFVGPLVAPVAGTIVAVNTVAAADPGLVERDPYEEGWMIELELDSPRGGPDGLTSGAEAIEARFRTRIAEYRRDGVLAE
jgi:glycine cleavage system H protein